MARQRLISDVITAPASWACYLFNGDCSGMENDDIQECNDWVEGVLVPGGWHVTGCNDEPCFIDGTDMLNYTILQWT